MQRNILFVGRVIVSFLSDSLRYTFHVERIFSFENVWRGGNFILFCVWKIAFMWKDMKVFIWGFIGIDSWRCQITKFFIRVQFFISMKHLVWPFNRFISMRIFKEISLCLENRFEFWDYYENAMLWGLNSLSGVGKCQEVSIFVKFLMKKPG